MQLIAMGMNMPKREIMLFDGDPINYPRFVKNFEVNIERSVLDDGLKLTYLIQQCTGKAKEAIQNCTMIQPEQQGYLQARDILQLNFGQKHIVVRAFIDRVTKGAQIRPGEPERLLQLGRDMKNCPADGQPNELHC